MLIAIVTRDERCVTNDEDGLFDVRFLEALEQMALSRPLALRQMTLSQDREREAACLRGLISPLTFLAIDGEGNGRESLSDGLFVPSTL